MDTSRVVMQYLEGESTTDIGKAHGVSRQRIHQIVNEVGVATLNTKARRKDMERNARTMHVLCSCGDFFRVPRAQVARAPVYCGPRCIKIYAPHGQLYLLRGMRRLAKQLGHTPTAINLANSSLPSAGTFIREFGSITHAQALAGLTPNVQGKAPSPLPEGFGDE